MASSGTYAFSVTNGEAVLAAYERIQIFAPQLRIEHMTTARRELNLLLAMAANKQVNLWKVELLSIDLVQGTSTYTVPGRTVMILDGYVSLNDGETTQTDRYITPISRTEYASYASKATQGPPTSYWFDRLISPTITFWPVPDGNGPYVFNYYACVQMQDANLAGGETPDVPYLWQDWLVAGLAHRLSRTYAPTLEALRKVDAQEAWDIAATQNVENVNLSLAPALGGYYRR
jgi:hypothetical protein